MEHKSFIGWLKSLSKPDFEFKKTIFRFKYHSFKVNNTDLNGSFRMYLNCDLCGLQSDNCICIKEPDFVDKMLKVKNL